MSSKAKAPTAPSREQRAADLAASWTTPQERQRDAQRRRDAAKEIARQDFRACAVAGDAQGALEVLRSMLVHTDRAHAWRTLMGPEATVLVRACPEILDVVAPGLDQLELEMLEVDVLPDEDLAGQYLIVRGESQRTTGGGACTAEQAEILKSAGFTVESREVRPDLAARFGDRMPSTMQTPANIRAGGPGLQVPVDLVEQGRADHTYYFKGFPFGRGLPITRTREVRIPAGKHPYGAPGVTRDEHGQCWYVKTVTETNGEDPLGPPRMLPVEVVQTLLEVDREFERFARIQVASPDAVRRRMKIDLSNQAMRIIP
jgi:hypothetical protein